MLFDDRYVDAIDTNDLPQPQTLWPTYGSGHNRPLLAIPIHKGSKSIDLHQLKTGMVITHNHCKGIISRIFSMRGKRYADIEYDDGTYEYQVKLNNVKHLGPTDVRSFVTLPLYAPTAIVLSISHARDAISTAQSLVEEIQNQLLNSPWSTPPNTRSSTPTSVDRFDSDDDDSDDDVEITGENLHAGRGATSERPIVLC